MKKIFILTALLFALSLSSQNNAQAFDWAMNPGANSNSLYALHYNSQGHLLVLASASDSADFGGNIVTALPSGSYPTTNYYIGKRNSNTSSQIVLQSRNGANNLFSNFSDFNMDANDNIIVVGATSGGHNFGNGVTLSNKGYMIAKYNSSGIAQWAKMYNFGNPNMNSFTTKPWFISCLPNGNIVAVLKESARFAYIKLDANGNELLYKEYTHTSNGSASISMTSSKNNCYIDNTGAFYLYINDINSSTVPFFNISVTTNSVSTLIDSTKITNGSHPAVSYLFAFKSDGSKKYFKGFRGSLVDLAVENVTGNVLLNWVQYGGQNNVAPMTALSGNNTTFSNSFKGIIAVDSLGNFLKKSIETPIAQQIALQSILPIGNFKIIGTHKYSSPNVLTAGAQSYSISSGGVFTWFELDQNLNPAYFVAAPLYNQNNSLANDAISTFNNKVAVGLSWMASVQSTLNINSTILKANNKNTSFPSRYNPPYNLVGQDIAIAQYDRSLQGSTSVKEIKRSPIAFYVYPNPTKGILNIKTDKKTDSPINMVITNILGEKVYEQYIEEENSVINTTFLNSGVFFINLIYKDCVSVKKIVVE